MTTYKATFSDLHDTNYQDWASVSAVSYTSYLDTWYGMTDDTALWMEAPWVITYLDNTDSGSCFMTPKWEWTASLSIHKSGPASSCAISRPGTVQDVRHRVRGKGRALQLHFENDGTNAFNILGWSILLDRNADY